MIYFFLLLVFVLQFNIAPFYIDMLPIYPDMLFSLIVFIAFKSFRLKVLLITFLLSIIQDYQINYNLLGSITFSNLIVSYILSTFLLNKNDNAGSKFLYMIILVMLVLKSSIFYLILSFGNNFSILITLGAIGLQSFITFLIIFIANEMIIPNKIIK